MQLKSQSPTRKWYQRFSSSGFKMVASGTFNCSGFKMVALEAIA